MWTGFRDLLFPKVCRICHIKLDQSINSPGNICSACWSKIEYIFPPYCLRCGHPSGDGHTAACHHCSTRTPAYAFARGVGKYTGTLRATILQLKLHYQQDIAEPLSNILIHYLLKSREFSDYKTYDYMVPVPLSRAKKRDREFNQVELIAQYISTALELPVSVNNLYRKRNTIPQMKLAPEKRLMNVQDAFAVREPEQFNRKKILLLDDIMTTGATVNECSHTLMRAGCYNIAVLVLARG